MKKHYILIAFLLCCLCSCDTQPETNELQTTTPTQIATAEISTTEQAKLTETEAKTTISTEKVTETEIDQNATSNDYSEYDYAKTYYFPEPLLLIDNDDIAVKCLAWGVFDDAFSLKIEAENKSDANVFLTADNSSINDYETDFHLYTEITAGKKAVDYIKIVSEDMNRNSIKGKEITKAEFVILVSDQNTWNTLFTSDIISIPIEQ